MAVTPLARSGTSYTRVPTHWSARHSTPAGWYDAALCIHSREGAWNAATGNGYEGGMQFLASTWLSAGGRLDGHGHWASVAAPREQLYRAFVVWRRDGGSWREWGTAGSCRLV